MPLEFGFSVELYSGGSMIARTSADPAPCVEDAIFRAVLAGALPNDGSAPTAVVSPIWAKNGPPVTAGLLVTLASGQRFVYEGEIFRLRARILLADAIRAQRVDRGARIWWRAVAIEPGSTVECRFHGRATRVPYPLRKATLRGVPSGALAFTIEPQALATIGEESKTAGAVECAGLLAGSVLYDAAAAAALVVISRAVPVSARAGGASAGHFAFSAGSLVSARDALERCSEDAVIVGWWHSHPPCAECESRPGCTLDTVFLSTDDARVHLSAFRAAYMAALVVGKLSQWPATQPGIRCYGWARGTIQERALHVRTPKGFVDTKGADHEGRRPSEGGPR